MDFLRRGCQSFIERRTKQKSHVHTLSTYYILESYFRKSRQPYNINQAGGGVSYRGKKFCLLPQAQAPIPKVQFQVKGLDLFPYCKIHEMLYRTYAQ